MARHDIWANLILGLTSMAGRKRWMQLALYYDVTSIASDDALSELDFT